MGTDSKINLSGLPASDADKLKVIDLSIGIVTYNARDWLKGCLESLYENTQLPSIEVIVVDNGSNDGVKEMLSQEFPEVAFIGNENNHHLPSIKGLYGDTLNQ